MFSSGSFKYQQCILNTSRPFLFMYSELRFIFVLSSDTVNVSCWLDLS